MSDGERIGYIASVDPLRFRNLKGSEFQCNQQSERMLFVCNTLHRRHLYEH